MIGRFLKRRSLRRHRPGYLSHFGGLWTDRPDALQHLESLVGEGALSPDEGERVRFWIEQGYIVLPGAVSHAVIDEINREVDAIWERRDERVRIEIGSIYHPVDPALRGEHCKLIDLYVHAPAILKAAFAPELRRFLEVVFEREVLLFQGLDFERGSGQPAHQDTAYVVVSSPLELAASWIALEDIQPGAGGLQYYPGSHRLPGHLFRGGYRNWNRRRDGDEAHFAYLDDLHTRAQAMGLELQTFLPKKGDVLVWAADLVHGGSEITDPSLGRRSFVGHYCPRDIEPYYFSYRAKHRTVRTFESGCHYSSSHYRLEPGPEPR